MRRDSGVDKSPTGLIETKHTRMSLWHDTIAWLQPNAFKLTMTPSVYVPICVRIKLILALGIAG